MNPAVIFDMDGTLFQTDKILERSLDDTFAYLRSLGEWTEPTPIDTYREIMGVPLPKVWETLLPTHSETIRKQIDTYFLSTLITNIHNGEGALYPNVQELFHYLKEHDYSIYIASNGLIDYLAAIVQYYGLDEWIDETFSIQHVQSLNKGDLVKKILTTHHIKQAVVVGDRLSDINAAKDNGLQSIGCNFDFAQADELAQADFVINDLLEIKDLVEPIY